MFADAVAACAMWPAAGRASSVAVNLSSTMLMHDGRVKHLLQLIARYGVPAANIVIETAKSSATRNTDLAMEILSRLRLHGCVVARPMPSGDVLKCDERSG